MYLPYLTKNNENVTNNKNSKGAKCSIEGGRYEITIHEVVKNCVINGKKFNSQTKKDLGGSTSNNDIECDFQGRKIGIEAKKCKTPDWMQCSIKFDPVTKTWKGGKRSKIPNECREMFDKLINDKNLYGGKIPPFMEKSITHEEWKKNKRQTDKWNDHYIDIPSNTIRKLYSLKKCYYIQISEYGLYHLGDDICKFGVPLFDIEQQIRIRIKVHRRKNGKGFCDLSVTAACQPIDIKKLTKSKYSLDNKDKLPPNLTYDDNL
tara:strand:- start:143 stop:928 length:786 start_codon:yes stop_codon:yes gene_type:complete